MNLQLVTASPEYQKQITDMLDEWYAAGEKIVPYSIRKYDYHNFSKYCENIDAVNTAAGHVPGTTFFCLDTDRDIMVGAVNIRHYLNEALLLTGGHIGDGVRPSERRKGVATAMIALALAECKKLGIHRVLMVCDKENIGSAKSIINNGGILENEVLVDGITEQRYWIELRTRCRWCNPANPLYIRYHDEEWGQLRLDDPYLFEMLILESFQAGLSWECILNKRDNFRRAYDGFDLDKVCDYDEKKIEELLADKGIVRNRLKIRASITNARIFRQIVQEHGSFHAYLNTFVHDRILYEQHAVTNTLSDAISVDLKKRGMKFVGSTIIYAYLQAIGVINSHEPKCFLYAEPSSLLH